MPKKHFDYEFSSTLKNITFLFFPNYRYSHSDSH